MRKIIVASIVLCTMEVTAVMADKASFADDAVGTAPNGWTATMTGKGNPKWSVEKDSTSPSKTNVVKQSGVATYPLLLKDGTSWRMAMSKFSSKPYRALRIVRAVSSGGRKMPITIMSSAPTRWRITSLRIRL